MSQITVAQLSSHIELLNHVGITFNPELDSRADLVRFFNISIEKACSMSEDQVYEIIDHQRDIEKGYINPEANTKKHVVCNTCGKDITKNVDSCGCEDGISYTDYFCECGGGATVEKTLWYE
jgi:hypothetical protein